MPQRGVLALQSLIQAREVVPEKDAEPGKILHEIRGGEMARLKEIPFGLYYGSDSPAKAGIQNSGIGLPLSQE